MQNRETAMVPYLSPTSEDETAVAPTNRGNCLADPEGDYVLPNEYTPKGRNCRAKLMRKLMELRVTADDSSFEEKAISALLRRLRRTQNSSNYSKLLKALEKKSYSTDCVLIPKSLDGRIQVDKRKAYPHLLYSKIWRWNHITVHTELIGLCKWAFANQLQKICVNPYHYMLKSKYQLIRDDPVEYKRFCETYVPGDAGPISSDANTSDSESESEPVSSNKPTEQFSDGEGEVKASNTKATATPWLRKIKASDQMRPIRIPVIKDIGDVYLEQAETGVNECEKSWLHIKYYEENLPYGNTVYVKRSQMKIVNDRNEKREGSNVASNDTVDVFNIQTIVNTSRCIDAAQIRDKLSDVDCILVETDLTKSENVIYIHNFTNEPIFVESPSVSLKTGERIIKIPPKMRVPIFSHLEFLLELEKSSKFGMSGLYDLKHNCALRVHLGNPCDKYDQVRFNHVWIELKVTKPLCMLDQRLKNANFI